MPEPTPDVYELAYEGFKRAPLGSSIVRAIVDTVWPLAVAEGRRQVIQVIADRLDAARAEPRHQPSERRGRITALGQLLEELEGASGRRDGEVTDA